MAQLAITIILSLFGGGALLTFLQFLITRHDEKKKGGIMAAIREVKADLENLRGQFEEKKAIDARVRIISFSDEILHNVQHSLEAFDQINQDIDAYRKYCADHPGYQNNKASFAIQNIEKVYAIRLEKNDFLH